MKIIKYIIKSILVVFILVVLYFIGYLTCYFLLKKYIDLNVLPLLAICVSLFYAFIIIGIGLLFTINNEDKDKYITTYIIK
jgi:membrane protease YdiL (CAAX protease family)